MSPPRPTVLIRCSYPGCRHSVSADTLSDALELAERMGYTELPATAEPRCREHSAPHSPKLGRPQ